MTFYLQKHSFGERGVKTGNIFVVKIRVVGKITYTNYTLDDSVTEAGSRRLKFQLLDNKIYCEMVFNYNE